MNEKLILFKMNHERFIKQTKPCGLPGLSKDPSPQLLMNMALRYDHALGCPGYYDSEMFSSGPSHQRRLDAALTLMRQLYEEVYECQLPRPKGRSLKEHL